jgi:hypothetical protein
MTTVLCLVISVVCSSCYADADADIGDLAHEYVLDASNCIHIGYAIVSWWRSRSKDVPRPSSYGQVP